MYSTDNVGNPIYDSESVREAIYQGKLDVLHTLDFRESYDINKFNQFADELDIDPLKIYNAVNTNKLEFDAVHSANWLMPDKYKAIDVDSFVLDRCETDEERQRATEELEAFSSMNLIPLLQYMIYLVDMMREHNVIWGVGRGSSVASFVLYKLDVHRINPLQYDLDWREFLR